jgi:hypothetical protein
MVALFARLGRVRRANLSATANCAAFDLRRSVQAFDEVGGEALSGLKVQPWDAVS